MRKRCDTVVCYFTPVPELYDPATQWALIDVWRRSWEKAGWTAVVLMENDIKPYERFHFFDEIFSAKPTEYGQPFTKTCFMRYVAAYRYGSLRGIPVLLSDTDVINYGMEPLDVYPNELTIFCDEPPASVFCGAVMGVPQHFLDMAELFAAVAPGPHDWNSHANCYHQDDLSLIARMMETKTLPRPEFLVKRPGSALFDYPSWRTSKLVHFGYAMKQLGYFPKAAHIEKLRRF